MLYLQENSNFIFKPYTSSNDPSDAAIMVNYEFGAATVTDFVLFYRSTFLYYTVLGYVKENKWQSVLNWSVIEFVDAQT